MRLRALGAAAILTVSVSQGAYAQSTLLCSNGATQAGFATGLATGTNSQSGVAAPAGEQWSEEANPAGDTTQANGAIGFGCQLRGLAANYRCADDFRVPAGPDWAVSSLVNFAYQTGFAGASSPVVGVNVQIWGPCPGQTVPGDAGCAVIAGDTTTNRLTASVFSSTRRILNSVAPPPGTVPGTTRRIWRNEITFTPPVLLAAGRYWFDFQVDAGAAGNFVPALTVAGQRGLPTYNGLQKPGAAAAYTAAIDLGNPLAAPDVPQDFPFEVRGTGNAQVQCIDTIFADGFD